MSLRQRAIAGLLLIAAVVGLVVLFTEDSDRPEVDRFAAPVVRVVPEPGDLVLRQARVGIVLEQGYDAVLTIGDTRIPEDQLIVNDALGEFFYQPGPGREIEAFAEGSHCVVADITNLVHPDRDPAPVRWCFRVS